MTAIHPEDIDLDYWARGNDIEFDYHNIEGKPCRAERSVSKPYEMQTYIKNWDGTVYNMILEFNFWDDKTGTGYFYFLNTWEETEKEEGETMEEIKSTETKSTEAKKTGYNFEKYNSNIREFLLSKRMAFHAPRGNAKTGEIPAWNLLPGTSCPSWAKHHCFTEGCYALKNALRAGYTIEKNSTLKAWAENTALAFYDLERLENELERYFSSMAAPRFFRIHGSGEFFSEAYAAMWYRIAQRHPETRFLAFSKAWPIIRKVHFYELDNFELVLSGWTGIEIPEDLRAWYRCAWCMDGIETRIPADALECPGSCESCGMCWNLSKLGKDTYFHKH